ncbi:hypothetical protein C8Q77DRAFT_162891 [Trametes polyzona]|nr:hypothetical protein C8Q77DRAFT_162891 [Trametes polyzona]
MIGTSVGLILYGMTVHQAYQYVRMYGGDDIYVKSFVCCLFVVETIHITTCVHSCYYYLVVSYFNPPALQRGIWSMQVQSVICALEILVSQGFFARRAYKLRPQYTLLVVLAVVFSLVAFVLGTAATAESIRVQTFASFIKYTWLDCAAFGAAVASDIITNGILIVVLKNSRTGFKQTDHVLDRLILYTINTGLLTGILNLLGLIFVRVLPNLVSFGIAIVVTKVYANSVLAVLNTRQSTTEVAESPHPERFGIHIISTRTETDSWAADERWSDRRTQQDARETGDVIDIKASGAESRSV